MTADDRCFAASRGLAAAWTPGALVWRPAAGTTSLQSSSWASTPGRRELLERRLSYAAGQDEGAALETIRGALELVEGPVFAYRHAERTAYVWVDVENWISTWELKVTEAAEDLTERYLAAGDPAGAIWASGRAWRPRPPTSG